MKRFLLYIHTVLQQRFLVVLLVPRQASGVLSVRLATSPLAEGTHLMAHQKPTSPLSSKAALDTCLAVQNRARDMPLCGNRGTTRTDGASFS